MAVGPRRSTTSEPVGRVRISPCQELSARRPSANPRAARLGEELGTEADEAARRDEEVQPHPAGAVVDHVLHASLAERQHLRHDAQEVLRDVDREPLDRLVQLAVDLARHDLRLSGGQLEPLAAHRLDQHGQLKLAAALDLPGVAPVRVDHGSPRSRPLCSTSPAPGARSGACPTARQAAKAVDADGHGKRRLVDRDHGQRARIGEVGDRLADRDLRDAREGSDDLAGPASSAAWRSRPLTFTYSSLTHLRDRAVALDPGDLLALRSVPWCTPGRARAADVRVGIRFVTRA